VALENGTPVRGGADLKVSCSMLGWMSMPVNVGVPGEEKYQHRKVRSLSAPTRRELPF
jgi:hypothetical protein